MPHGEDCGGVPNTLPRRTSSASAAASVARGDGALRGGVLTARAQRSRGRATPAGGVTIDGGDGGHYAGCVGRGGSGPAAVWSDWAALPRQDAGGSNWA